MNGRSRVQPVDILTGSGRVLAGAQLSDRRPFSAQCQQILPILIRTNVLYVSIIRTKEALST